MQNLDPSTEYQKRLGQWRGILQSAAQNSTELGNYRLAVAVAAALLAYLAFVRHAVTGWWLLIPLAAFIGLVVYHERVVRAEAFAKRGIAYYERALLRLDDRWAGSGNAGEQFADPTHVYASDLDIFGRGSLFELISTARTAAGEHKLASWFLHPSSAVEVRERQQAAAEMRDAVQFREDLALLGEDIRAGVHADLLARWGSASPVPLFAGARAASLTVASFSLLTFTGFMSHWFRLTPFVISAAVALTISFLLRRAVDRIVASIDTPANDLDVLSLVLGRVEGEDFAAPLLKRIRGDLTIEGLPASARIQQLRRRMEFLDSSDHLMVRAAGWALLWRPQAALAVEAWRQDNGPHIGRWMAAIAELEAISSLASFAFEHPDATYPELVQEGPLFEAEALRHPLISGQRAVPNHVVLSNVQRLLIVSGSNMSGKSTLLRSIGLNAVLAWAGGPVTASRLRISSLAVGASIRIVDSLQDGKSRFYAEITRVREIVKMTEHAVPVLFLLDELLSGTNSHDRRIGAEAVIRTLFRRGAVGLVTTHDLALTRMQEEFGTEAVNVHFEDHLEDGHISFDYKLKPGVVERSNALELMRAVGLEV